MLFNSVFTIFWDFNIQCRVCYTACSVNRRETVSLFKFPIKSLMIPFELNWPVSLITIYILYVIITEVSFPPSRISTPGGVQGKPGGLSKTPATRPTVCFLCCPQGDVSVASDPALADWGTAFSPQAIRLMNSQKWPTLQHTPTHTTCHPLHFNTVQLDYTHTLH